MKKLIPTTLLLLPVAGLSEMVSHDFVIHELPAPSVSTGEYLLMAQPNTTIYNGTTYNCSTIGKTWQCLFRANRHQKLMYYSGFAARYTHIGYRCNNPGLFEATIGFSLGGDPTVLRVGYSEGSAMVPAGQSNDLRVESLYLIGKTGGGAGSSVECTIYGGTTTQPYQAPIGKFLLNTDFGSNGIHYGLTITPSILTLSGRPGWSGSVRIKGAGYAGRLTIQSDRDIRINLGQGWSGSGRSFETRLMSGDVPLSYEGLLRVRGELQTPGTTTYNVRVTHVVE